MGVSWFMINVDIIELKTKLDNLEKLISDYDNIEMNLFNHLKNSFISWEDTNSLRFQNAILSDKKENIEFKKNLRESITIFKKIYKYYISIGKKININLNDKSNIMNLLENILSKTKNIERKINQINASEVSEIRYKIKRVNDNINMLKDSYRSLYQKLENIEFTIKNNINKLETVKINDLEVF